MITDGNGSRDSTDAWPLRIWPCRLQKIFKLQDENKVSVPFHLFCPYPFSESKRFFRLRVLLPYHQEVFPHGLPSHDRSSRTDIPF
jgi:hypothetical protein